MRITEMPNPITAGLDRAKTTEIPGLLARAERQIFAANPWGEAMAADSFRKTLTVARHQVQQALRLATPVVISGAGTSGRIALHAAALHPQTASRTLGLVHGTMAGGVEAFFFAKERVEDMPEIGKRDLEAFAPEPQPVLLIGITCGLSAAYVAGQVEAVLARPQAQVVLIGFNPADAAPNRPLPGLDAGFRDCLSRWQSHPRFQLLNPIIGPEPLTGSTRMKGGTATKILLDILLGALPADEALAHFAAWHRAVYESSDVWPGWIERAGEALCTGGAIRYAAAGRDGLMTLLDASECPPTFGADPRQVWPILAPSVAGLLPGFDCSPFFDTQVAPTDALFDFGGLPAAWTDAWADAMPVHMPLKLQAMLAKLPASLVPGCRDLWLKWVCNTISTGAFVQAGKVFGNRMIDLKISNRKLWERALQMVMQLAEVDEPTAATHLRWVIAGQQETANDSLDDLISLAVKQRSVLVTAVLMARHGWSQTEARERLKQIPKLCDHL